MSEDNHNSRIPFLHLGDDNATYSASGGLTIEDQMKKADGLFATGDYPHASRYYARILSYAPEFDYAQRGLVKCIKMQSISYKALLAIRDSIEDILPGNWQLTKARAGGVVLAAVGFSFGQGKKNPELASSMWWLALLAIIPYLIALLIDHLTTLRAFLTPYRNKALAGGYGTAAFVGAASLITALALVALYPSIDHYAVLAGAVVCTSIGVQTDKVLRVRGGVVQAIMGTYVSVALGCGFYAVGRLLVETSGKDSGEGLPLACGICMGVWGIFMLLAGWVSRFCGDWLGTFAGPYVDPTTRASDPGGVHMSKRKLRRFRPELFGIRSLFFRLLFSEAEGSAREMRQMMHDHLYYGDSRAAVVLSTTPLLVAAYTDELDAVAVLRFDQHFVGEYGLYVGSRLLTVNTYSTDVSESTDLHPGVNALGNWQAFWPFIADFLTDDLDRVENRKREISEKEWKRTEELGREYLTRYRHLPRDGNPLFSSTPISPYDYD